MKRMPLIAAIALLGLGVLAIAADKEFDPHWRVGDAWKVRTTYHMCINRQKVVGAELVELVKTTKLVYPYPQLFDSEIHNVEYTYRVERIQTNGIAEISVTAPTNRRVGEVWDWRLYFNTNQMVLKRMDKMFNDGSGRFDRTDVIRGERYFSFGGVASVLNDWVSIPSDSNREKRVFFPGGCDKAVSQESAFDGTGVTLRMIETNALDGLDRKVTIRWQKGNKWWTSAKEELGTNLVKCAVLVE